ncbi:MAG: hypothetical protein A2Z72_07005 [Omnitrophica bacterium RBG_13_46_9]|nr:MAG: hypothetical protein A2Z72_07005 [Omnitrophica bacterium RBG_13_46_9]
MPPRGIFWNEPHYLASGHLLCIENTMLSVSGLISEEYLESPQARAAKRDYFWNGTAITHDLNHVKILNNGKYVLKYLRRGGNALLSAEHDGLKTLGGPTSFFIGFIRIVSG